MKMGRFRPVLMSDPLASVSLARKRQEQVQQADEDIVDVVSPPRTMLLTSYRM